MLLLQRSKDISFLRDTAQDIGLGILRKEIRKALIASIFQAGPIIKKHVPKESKDRVACNATRMILLLHLLARVLKVPANDKAIVPFSIMVPIVDDLTDKEGKALSEGDIARCFISPNGKLFCNLLYKTTQNVKNINKFEETIFKVGALQSESKKQLNGNGNSKLTREALEDISFKKGGYTGQLLLYLLKSDPSKEEETAFYHMFRVMQLIDDLEDYKEDKEHGQHTLVTEGYYTANDILNLIMDMEKEWLKIYGLRALCLTNGAKIYFFMAFRGHNTIGTWLEHRPYLKTFLLG